MLQGQIDGGAKEGFATAEQIGILEAGCTSVAVCLKDPWEIRYCLAEGVITQELKSMTEDVLVLAIAEL